MSSFVTTTRHDTESTYAMDTFFHASNYASPTHPSSDPHSKGVVTSSPTSQSNLTTYDCLPQQGTTSTLENLSVQHAIGNEWMSPLGYPEYNQPDMNFLFTYNELMVANKPKDTKSSDRRFSVVDQGSSYSFASSSQKVVGSSPFIDYHPSLFQLQKERASMPDAFAPQHPTVTNDDYLQQQQTGVSWNQHGLLPHRPVCTTPIKEEDDTLNQDLTKYNYMMQNNTYCPPTSDFNQPILSSSTSSPLKKHAKKRSIIDEVMHQDATYSLPSVVPSVSEPIPTTWMHRKRTKSIRDTQESGERMEETYAVPSCDNEFGSHQLLAAMPRRQKLRYEGDSYTPKWVRYTGHLKEGYCDSCQPGKWLQLKNSAYWYHKQFYHGISSVSGKSFMKPLEQRMGKGDMIEGLCHQCHRFVPACNGKKKNNYMLWYRHAHKCHLYDKPKSTLKTMRKLSITTIPK